MLLKQHFRTHRFENSMKILDIPNLSIYFPVVRSHTPVHPVENYSLIEAI
jgi:hypothetical protein